MVLGLFQVIRPYLSSSSLLVLIKTLGRIIEFFWFRITVEVASNKMMGSQGRATLLLLPPWVILPVVLACNHTCLSVSLPRLPLWPPVPSRSSWKCSLQNCQPHPRRQHFFQNLQGSENHSETDRNINRKNTVMSYQNESCLSCLHPPLSYEGESKKGVSHFDEKISFW